MSIREAGLEEKLRLLREAVQSALNYVAAGGRLTRGHDRVKELRRVHRFSAPTETDEFATVEYWQNVACNIAFWAGMVQYRLEGPWQAVLESMLDTGGTQLTSAAIAMAELLGIELRVSTDGGKNWVPIPAVRLTLEQLSDGDLVAEMVRRGAQLPDDRVREPTPAVYTSPPVGRWLREQVRRAAQSSSLGVSPRLDRPVDRQFVESMRTNWEHRCDADDRLVVLDRGEQCGRCGERDPVWVERQRALQYDRAARGA